MLLVALGELVARHVKKLLLALGLILVMVAGFLGHSEISADLHYALAKASAQLSPLFVAYETAGEFNAQEVLELNRPELQQAIDSWPKFRTSLYLQVFNTRERVFFDSRSGRIGSYKMLEPVSSSVRYGDWRKDRPFLYVDWAPSQEDRWILRTAVTAPDYFTAHAWRLLPLLVLLFAIAKLLLTSGEVRRRRRFDELVGVMPNLLRHAQTEEMLVQEVPRIITYMLDFDSVAFYLLEGEHIVPKAYFSKAMEDRGSFLSTSAEMILTQDDEPEARAIRENKSILVYSPQDAGKTHPAAYRASDSRPYVIVPLRRGGDAAPTGLLTAQRHAGLQRQHADFLLSVAEIVALLLENIRSRKALERIYRKMIRNTRLETLGTVVPFIAHNMRTPLVVVEGLAESICNDFGSLNHAELEKRISEIKEQTSLCFQLIRSISQYNRLGNTPTSSLDVRQGLERVCGFFAGYFRVKNIRLEARYKPNFRPSVQMEELDFVQVVTNLLINADDAFSEMRKGGDEEMTRDHLKIEVVLEPEDEKARIVIADNGPGIRQEVIHQIFDQDFTTKDYGTGVGLSYCRRVIEEGGGKIDVASEYGVGTVTSILLPITGRER